MTDSEETERCEEHYLVPIMASLLRSLLLRAGGSLTRAETDRLLDVADMVLEEAIAETGK
jgi:hypothetical protein